MKRLESVFEARKLMNMSDVKSMSEIDRENFELLRQKYIYINHKTQAATLIRNINDEEQIA